MLCLFACCVVVLSLQRALSFCLLKIMSQQGLVESDLPPEDGDDVNLTTTASHSWTVCITGSDKMALLSTRTTSKPSRFALHLKPSALSNNLVVQCDCLSRRSSA